MRIGRGWACAVVAAALAGCDTDAADEPARVLPVDSAAVPPAEAAVDTAAAMPDTALTVTVVRRGERRFSLEGRTRAADALEVTVEDGHNVLYGPTSVEVADGAFRTELAVSPTPMETVYAYITDPAGTRQWVVPIPLDSARVRWP